MIYQNINVNINPGGFPAIIRCSQYDSDVAVTAQLIHNGQAMQLEEGTTATIQGSKPSGLGFTINGTVNHANGRVSFTVAPIATEEAGDIPAEIVLYYDGRRIGTANFIIYVEDSPHPEGTIDGDTESAKSLVEQMEVAVEQAQTAAASVNPQIVSSADTEPVLVADAQKVYVYTQPVTAMDLTPDSSGITSVFFTASPSGCTLTVPDTILIPPGMVVTAGTGTNAIALPAGYKYELNIFQAHLLVEAWK